MKVTHKTERTGRRIRFEVRKYSDEQRAELKAEHIRETQEWEPPEEYFEAIYLNPGDEGYDGATVVETYIWSDFSTKEEAK